MSNEIPSTIPHLIARAADLYGQNVAISEEQTRISYTELYHLCLQAQRAFIASGIKHGDRVAICAPNIHEWVIAAIGLQSVGAILVPLSTRAKGKELGYALRNSGARILLTVSGFLDIDYVELIKNESLPELECIVMLRGEKEGAINWETFLERAEEVSAETSRQYAEAVTPEDVSDMLHTSGTTGQPKGVLTCHGQNIRAFDSWSEIASVRPGDQFLIVNPFFLSFGYKAGWLAAIIRGATIIPQLVFESTALLKKIEQHKVNVLPGAPTLFQSLLAEPTLKQFDLSSLRVAITGAANIPVELIKDMRRVLGIEVILSAYGLTECCGVASMCRPEDDFETIANTSGQAIPGVQMRCVDMDNNELAAGEKGEIVIRGYNIMAGYFNNEDATRDTIDEDGWLHTGDIGVLDEHGYVRITDRKKDMFTMGGFNCYPAEIENIMYSHADLVQVAVVGVPDERMGEVGMAFVVTRVGAELTTEQFIEWCRENMANYKVPRYVEFRDSLPLNASGKIQKNVIREEAKQIIANK